MVENIANDLGMKILRDLKKQYLNNSLGFENQVDKDIFFRSQITSDLAKSVTTIRFLLTVAPAELYNLELFVRLLKLGKVDTSTGKSKNKNLNTCTPFHDYVKNLSYAT